MINNRFTAPHRTVWIPLKNNHAYRCDYDKDHFQNILLAIRFRKQRSNEPNHYYRKPHKKLKTPQWEN